MNDSILQTLTITDFRSIHGTVVIPLDAPVVLVHGPNGAGKTSIMSALELALNGRIADLADPDQRHLVHRGARTAAVELTTSHGTARITTDDTRTEGQALLKRDDARFFTERCYLAQRRLGQLLEIYAAAKPDGDTPLTRFVKDLLGLDELDSLIDGLEPVRDTRLVKNLVPEYRSAVEGFDREHKRLDAMKLEQESCAAHAATVRRQLTSSLETLGAPATADPELAGKSLERWLAGADVQAELERLQAAEREIRSARSRYETLASRSGAGPLLAEGKAAAGARDAADAWWASSGAKLETLLDEIRGDIPTIAAAVATDPETARTDAIEQVTSELQRVRAALAADEKSAAEIKRLDTAMRTAQKRVEKIDGELASGAATATGRDLANALAALVPHLQGDECPVCGRDYGEVADQPLASHLAEEISRLSAQAERMQQLATARLDAVATGSNAVRQRERQLTLRLDPYARESLAERETRFERYRKQLTRLKSGVIDGATIMRRAAETEQRRAVAQWRDRETGALTSALELLCTSMELKPRRKNETAGETIERLERHVAPRVQQIQTREETRVGALSQLERLRALQAEQHTLDRDTKAAASRLVQTRLAIKTLEQRRSALKKLRDDAQKQRTQIIRQVFNSSLNGMWRNLFVRLAPDEPFVPAFEVPDGRRGAVTANLTTTHRDGKPGGSPAAMLSAGNLNTAALTLFLALHLTAKPTLPWLLLDDPVQSMDEVHVAQLAAVLRTLTRQHGRRIMIAVHERALFDYLALELTPATAQESLITIEMTRNPDGETTLVPAQRGFVSDPALAAA